MKRNHEPDTGLQWVPHPTLEGSGGYVAIYEAGSYRKENAA